MTDRYEREESTTLIVAAPRELPRGSWPEIRRERLPIMKKYHLMTKSKVTLVKRPVAASSLLGMLSAGRLPADADEFTVGTRAPMWPSAIGLTGRRRHRGRLGQRHSKLQRSKHDT